MELVVAGGRGDGGGAGGAGGEVMWLWRCKFVRGEGDLEEGG